MISTREQVSRIVSRSDLHQEVVSLKERLDACTAQHEADRKAEQALNDELQSARPDLEARGQQIHRLQKVRRVLPKLGFGATLVTLPCMSLGASFASPVILGVALVGALTIGGSILGIETLKSKLPARIDGYNADVERFNRRSAQLDGLREETRKSRLTLEAARARYEEKHALEQQVVDETSRMADAAGGLRPAGSPDIEDRRDEVVIGSIRLPKITPEP